MKIYVASSWRNPFQQTVVRALRAADHEVYDFRNPEPGNSGFSWKSCASDEDLKNPDRFRQAVLQHPTAVNGFNLDMAALRASDAVVLVLPCGRSAHLELGWAAGAGKQTIVLLDNPMSEPELMYLMNTMICVELAEVVQAFSDMPKRFFMVHDDGARYSVVAKDIGHVRRLLSDHEFGDPSQRFVEAEAAGIVSVVEMDSTKASEIRCNTDGDERERGSIPLTSCDMGEWFCSEF